VFSLRSFSQGELSAKEAAMRKRNVQKAVVVLVFLSFLGLSASGLMAGTTSDRSVKLSFSLLFRSPAQFLAALFPGLRGILKIDNPSQPPSSDTVKVIKPTADITVVKLSGRD
jgi:hypothetical protein